MAHSKSVLAALLAQLLNFRPARERVAVESGPGIGLFWRPRHVRTVLRPLTMDCFRGKRMIEACITLGIREGMSWKKLKYSNCG